MTCLLGDTSGPMGPQRHWGTPQGLGVISGPLGAQGTWHVLGERPWSHGISRALENPKVLSLGDTLVPGDTSRPWGSSGTCPVPGGHLCCIRPPRAMSQVISGGPRIWGHPGLRATQGALGMLQMVSPSASDTGVPAGHHPGIPSIGPVPGSHPAATRAQPRRVGATAAPCQRRHLPHREQQCPGDTLHRGTGTLVTIVTVTIQDHWGAALLLLSTGCPRTTLSPRYGLGCPCPFHVPSLSPLCPSKA